MREKFQALVMEIILLHTYETNASSLCFTVRAANSYKTDCIPVLSF